MEDEISSKRDDGAKPIAQVLAEMKVGPIIHIGNVQTLNLNVGTSINSDISTTDVTTRGRVLPKRDVDPEHAAQMRADFEAVLSASSITSSKSIEATSSKTTAAASTRPKITIHASNAAAFSGLHKYKSPEDGLKTVLENNAWVVPNQKVDKNEILTKEGKKIVEERKEEIKKLISAPDIPTVEGVDVPAAVLKFTSMTGVVLDLTKEIKTMKVEVQADVHKPLELAPIATTAHVEVESAKPSERALHFSNETAKNVMLAFKDRVDLAAHQETMASIICDGTKDIVEAFDGRAELIMFAICSAYEKAYSVASKLTKDHAELARIISVAVVHATRGAVACDMTLEKYETASFDDIVDEIAIDATAFITKLDNPDLRSKTITKTVEVPIEVIEYYKEVKAALDHGAEKDTLQVASAVPIPDSLPADVARHIVIERGNVSEIPSLARFELPGYKVKAEQRHVLVKFKNFTLSGKTDACIYKGSKLVGIIEVKNRKTRAFAARGINNMLKKDKDGKDMAYDLRQLACYWRGLPDLEFYYLLEVVESELHPASVESDVLKTIWDEMEPILETKCGELLDKWEQS